MLSPGQEGEGEHDESAADLGAVLGGDSSQCERCGEGGY